MESNSGLGIVHEKIVYIRECKGLRGPDVGHPCIKGCELKSKIKIFGEYLVPFSMSHFYHFIVPKGCRHSCNFRFFCITKYKRNVT